MSQDQASQRDLGETDSPVEDDLEYAFERLITEGVQRLHRTWYELLATGFMAGAEVALGVLAYLAVKEATGSSLLAGLAFSIGFLALLLGRSELFTEGFLIPVTTAVAKRASWGQVAKLWSGTLLANLVGGWAVMWLIITAFPDLHEETVKSAEHFVLASLNMETVALSILGGAVITLMTRMQHGTEEMVGKVAAAVAGAFLLAGLEMFHSILDSLIIFGAIHTGDASFGYLDWLGWFWWVTLGNIVGGVLIITLLRLVRTFDRISDERAAAEKNEPGTPEKK